MLGWIRRASTLSLGAKTLDCVRVTWTRTHQLDRDFLSILAIGSLGTVHRAHSAVSEGAQQAPWPKTVAEQRIRARRISLPIDDESFDRECAVLASGGQHRFELVAQSHILATRFRQELPPRFNRLSAGQLEELLDPLPVHGIHDCPSRPSGFIRGTLSPGPPYTLARGDPDTPLRSRGSLASARSRCL